MEYQNTSKGEHYNLRWNNYTDNLIQVFSEHQHHETLVDVTLTCEGQFIKAHKLILSACSGFFQDMFKMHNVPHPFVVLTGIKFNYLKHVLEFIYHGEVKILDTDLPGVLALGESFQVKGLSSVKLKQPLPPQNDSRTTSVRGSGIEALDNSIYDATMLPQKENIRSTFRANQIGNNRTESNNLRDVQNSGRLQNNKEGKEIPRKKIRIGGTLQTNNSKELEISPKESFIDGGKIPRPTNAFMLFAKEWRRKLAVEHPDENNKGISVKLGNMWKSLSQETKESYYLAAREAQKAHEIKYPGYSYNPQEARKRKVARRKTIDSVPWLASTDIQEYDEDDDDLQIIEINEDPIDITDIPDSGQ